MIAGVELDECEWVVYSTGKLNRELGGEWLTIEYEYCAPNTHVREVPVV